MSKATTVPPVAAVPPTAPDPLFDESSRGSALAIRPEVETVPGVFVAPPMTGIQRSNVMGEEQEFGRESSAIAAQVKATIQSRIIQAIQRPRSLDDVRIRILTDCKRPAFAKAAIFRKPVAGSNIEGLSIRFAESAIRHMTNIASDTMTVYEDPGQRRIRVSLVDLESNTWHTRDITLLKSVERSTLKPGQVAVSQRINSKGEIVYTVIATDDELATKEAAARSKVIRNEGLRLVPADILDEAFQLCKKTRASDDAKDPKQTKKDISDAFAELGIKPADLAEYLGCELDQASPVQVAELREWYVAVKEGDTTWSGILSAKIGDLKESDPDGSSPATAKVDSLKEKARAAAAARKKQ